jgi:hypothetical protein
MKRGRPWRAILDDAARRRKVAACIIGLVILADDGDAEAARYLEGTYVDRAPNVARARMDWGVYSASLSDREWQRRYGMTRELFHTISAQLRPLVEPPAIARGSGRTASRAIGANVRLSVALRYLRGGKYYDLADVHGIADVTAQALIMPCLEAIASVPEWAPRFPLEGDDEYAAQCAAATSRGTESFAHCIGGIDGVLVAIKMPSAGEVGGDVRMYFSRKGVYVLAACLVRVFALTASHRPRLQVRRERARGEHGHWQVHLDRRE